MKILLTTHHLLDFTGSELYTLTLADYLTRNGHEVVVYSRYIDQIDKYFKKLKIPLVNDLQSIHDQKFDIAHVHHNINAVEVRRYFPHLPMVFMAHGILPLLEQPPVLNLKISQFLAISNEVRIHLIKCGVPAHKITISHNLFDAEILKPAKSISARPTKILVISPRLDEKREKIIRQAGVELEAKVQFVGGRFGWVAYDRIPKLINENDVVFSLGRGAIEAMLCGWMPFIYDYQGGDGMVTPDNYTEILKNNFSGRRYHKEFTAGTLAKEIRIGYNPDRAETLHKLALRDFDGNNQIKKILKVYGKARRENIPALDSRTDKLMTRMVSQYQEVRGYTWKATTRIDQFKLEQQLAEKDKEILNLKIQLKSVTQTKFYRIWQAYGKYRDRFLKFIK